MDGFSKYYKKTWQERLDILVKQNKITLSQRQMLESLAVNQEIGDIQIENFITQYQIPEGLAMNYVINGKEYIVPMVTEEPSVIAASSHGAGIIKRSGGLKAKIHSRLMMGQVVLENVDDAKILVNQLQTQISTLIEVANQAHPSIVKRGGGAREIEFRILAPDMVSVDLFVDVQEAMGANILNTMLEAVAAKISEQYHRDILMSILSNYATKCLVTATCEIPIDILGKNGIDGKNVAQKFAQASRLAQLDPYRAATHNKGIMNGVDAVVIASGNDWRAVEASCHAYASKDGQYRGLSSWEIQADKLVGKITLPLPVGAVGGSIGIVPLAKLNKQLLTFENAKELETIIASVGLAQNFAALYALVTEGIQKGHMRLQLKSLAKSIGANEQEITRVINELEKIGKRDSNSAQAILEKIRGEK
ncbi:3-hydroxy-3-methylglutaryl-coenzyme a reductase [Ligilactobacillus hayakitensis DSM 18933 = JCM 14209]|uniref:3-hydroxy-3-methylglutaryl coenzyme A reductase n=1 Tax=Ligilactobacillus hayakitensis DSM 18933 = JCM 14209 TaxID=1423755 RepID=A0A0R1WPU4_9LACO|nr:hydroxymethylglutaryl-CoA reductase, degradative [Ligilactobacillus hayakitensis]KRM17867.1 3-hydroxy-3-methylglutaryl-coenzyme a reductase [Ligilactobacillus hayakitensis DSM 18933 = JCM 14209]